MLSEVILIPHTYVHSPSGKLIKQIPVNTDKGSGYGINLSFSGDRKWLAVGEDNKTASLYHTSDWKLTYTFKPAEGWCGGCGTYIEFSPNNKSFFKISHNDKLSEYDLTTGNLIKTYGEPVNELRGVAITMNGQHFLFASDSML